VLKKGWLFGVVIAQAVKTDHGQPKKKGKLVVKVGNWWSCGQDDWMTGRYGLCHPNIMRF